MTKNPFKIWILKNKYNSKEVFEIKILKFLLSILKDIGCGLIFLFLLTVVTGLILLGLMLVVFLMSMISSFYGGETMFFTLMLIFIFLFICMEVKCSPFKMIKTIIENIIEYFQDKWNQIN